MIFVECEVYKQGSQKGGKPAAFIGKLQIGAHRQSPGPRLGHLGHLKEVRKELRGPKPQSLPLPASLTNWPKGAERCPASLK